MKLVLTISEAKQIVNSHFTGLLGRSVDIDIVPDNTEAVNLANQIKAAVDLAGLDTLNNKIPRIKQLRTVIPGYGLADAKYAIENWDRFLSYIRATGKVPWSIASNGIPTATKPEDAPF